MCSFCNITHIIQEEEEEEEEKEEVSSNGMAGSDHENNDIFPDPDKDQDDSGSLSGSRHGEDLSKLSNSSCQSLENTVDNSDSSGGNESNEGPVEASHIEHANLDQNSNSAGRSFQDLCKLYCVSGKHCISFDIHFV